MTNYWNRRISDLRDQIEQLRDVLNQQETVDNRQRADLQKATSHLKDTLNTPAADANVLSNLFNLLQNGQLRQVAGTIVVAADGSFVLFSSSVEHLLGPLVSNDPLRHLQGSVTFYLPDKVTPCPQEELPWVKSVHGVDVNDMKLFVKRPDLNIEGLWIIASGTPLRNANNDASGAVIFVADATEQIQMEEQIKTLIGTFEEQITTIENGYQDLKLLAKKLAEKDWSAEVEPAIFPAPDTATKATAASNTTTAPRKLVLIVDDIPVNQKLLALQLKRLDIDTQVANNGQEAVDAVAKQKYDAVFMDVDMPVLDGCQATMAIRDAEKGTNTHLPIIAMTSLDRTGDSEKCLSSGMDAYVAKGVNQQKLREVLDFYLNKPEAANASVSDFSPNTEGDKIDLRTLTEDFGADEVAEIIRLFVACSTTLVKCLESAIEDRDLHTITHMAYSVKGPCASLRLTKSTRLATEICEESELGAWSRAREKYEMLNNELQRVRTHIGVAALAASKFS